MALQKAVKASQAQGFKFVNEGDSLKGYYQGQVTKTINGSPAIEHTYKTEAGLLSVLGQANILNQYKNNNIEPGTYVEITFTGNVQRLKNGRTMKVYDVAFDNEDTDSSPTAPTDDSAEPETDLDADEVSDVAPYVAPKAASAPRTVTTSQQAKVQSLLNSRK